MQHHIWPLLFISFTEEKKCAASKVARGIELGIKWEEGSG